MKINSSLPYMLALLAAAFFWGTTFVAQSLGASAIGSFTFLMLRSYIGTALVLFMIAVRDAFHKKTEKSGDAAVLSRHLLIAGICCGVCLFLASALQQYGIERYVTDGDVSGTAKSSFITAMYVILVPIFSIVLGKKPRRRIWFGVVLCVAGLYLLCLSNTLMLTRGDFYMLLCALGFSVQIMTVDHFSPQVDGLKLSALEFFVTGVLSTVCVLFFDHPTLAGIYAALPAVLYAAVFSNAIAYTCQIIGQRGVKPTIASLIMCLESVFGVLAARIILHETLSARQIAGCVLMFSALLLVSIPVRKEPAPKKEAPRRSLS